MKRSPVVISAATGLKVGGKINKVRVIQSRDWRLSYAINGFTLKRTKKGYVIQQWIEFDKTGTIPTDINFGVGKLRVPDAIVHTFDCTPFWVICEFKSLKLYFVLFLCVLLGAYGSKSDSESQIAIHQT